MSLNVLGDHPLATNQEGQLLSRIGTIFPGWNTLVTLPGMAHFPQRLSFVAHLQRLRAEQGLPPLSKDAQMEVMDEAVDLIMTGNAILIRPEPSRMPLALQADEQLQEIASKRRIRFLRASHRLVQQAIRERGEYWRISPYPRDDAEITAAIGRSRIALGGLRLYYYNEETGTRYLTCQAFEDLSERSDEELRFHLVEIRDSSSQFNKSHHPEVAFFAADGSFGAKTFAAFAFEEAAPGQLRAWHAELCERFRMAVPPDLHRDSPESQIWRNRMFAALMDEQNDTLSDALVSDLTPEFFRMVRWLPGGRIEHGELIFDSIFEDRKKYRDDPELAMLCDERVKSFICNYVREFGNIQYVNIGWVAPSLGHRRANAHRVYLAEVMSRDAEKPALRILRIQQWGIREHLERGRDLLWAITASMEYTEYTLDRRLACWQLGMPLPGRMDTRMAIEVYDGTQQQYHGFRLWTAYFERDFIQGLATNKIPDQHLKDPEYALTVARLLGTAAAPNMVVGRTIEEGSTEVVFDGGDEMILSDENGRPDRIVVADHAGTFHEYTSPLAVFAAGYAKPASKRLPLVPDPEAFIEAYLAALSDRLSTMQSEFREQRPAFLTLFQNSKQGPKTFSDRWAKALDRLDKTHVPALIDRIRSEIQKQRAP